MMDCICGHALNTHVFGCKECRAIGGCSCKTYQIVRSPGPEHERDWQWRWEKLKRFLEQEEAEAEIIRKKPNIAISLARIWMAGLESASPTTKSGPRASGITSAASTPASLDTGPIPKPTT